MTSTRTTYLRLVAAFLAVAIGLGMILYFSKMQEFTTAMGCDSKSMRTAASEPFRTEVEKRSLEQMAVACDAGRTRAEAEGAAPAETTASATTTPPATQPVDFQVRYLANEPVVSTKWENSYNGNPVARKPELAGRDMESLSVEEALQESEYRRKNTEWGDPMLTVAEAIQFGVLPQMTDQAQLAKTAELANNHAMWDTVNAEISRVKRTDYTAEVKTLSAGRYRATFAIAMSGDTPVFGWDLDVNRETDFRVVQFTRKSDGHVEIQRLACGLQDYEFAPAEAVSIPVFTAPYGGIKYTEEHVPYVPRHGGETPTPSTPQTTPSETPPVTTPPVTTPPVTTPPVTTPPVTTPPVTTPPVTTTPKIPGEGSTGGDGGGTKATPGPGTLAPQVPLPSVFVPAPAPQPAPGPPAGSTPTSNAPAPAPEPGAGSGSTPNAGDEDDVPMP